MLHLACGEEGPFWVAKGVVAPKSDLNEVLLCLDRVGDGGELDIRVAGVAGVGPVSKVQ